MWSLTLPISMCPGNSAHLVCICNNLHKFTNCYLLSAELTNFLLISVVERVFDKPSDAFIHIDQLNLMVNLKGVEDPPPIRHPRAAHTLLGYTPLTISFIKKTPGSYWVGGK